MADSDEEFISKTESKIQNLITNLGWNLNHFTKNDEQTSYVDCPNNKGHKIPEDRLDKHLEKCDLSSNGYTKDDIPFPMSFASTNYVTMTPELQEMITRGVSTELASGCVLPFGASFSRLLRPVPQSSSRLFSNFTREERLAIYEYVRQKTETGSSIPDTELVLPERKEEKRELTEIEKAILERDARRRRATYRNKVHLNKKTHTEIMREVIASQMEDMAQTDKNPDTEKKKKKRDRSRDRHPHKEKRKKEHRKKSKKRKKSSESD